MKTIQIIVAIAVIVTLTSCDDSKTQYWAERQVPTTDEERRAVAEQVAKILAATPRTLSGDDQDWDDAIEAATKSARESLCRPTLWEHKGYGLWTGKWKYIEENAPRAKELEK